MWMIHTLNAYFELYKAGLRLDYGIVWCNPLVLFSEEFRLGLRASLPIIGQTNFLEAQRYSNTQRGRLVVNLMWKPCI